MDREIVEREDIFDNKCITIEIKRRMLKLGLEMRDEYENAKRYRIRAYEEGKLIYHPMLDRIR